MKVTFPIYIHAYCTRIEPRCIRKKETVQIKEKFPAAGTRSASAILSAAMIRCPHDGCGDLLVYEDEFHHQIGCTHASCACPEPGCTFAGSPIGLVCHLEAAHSFPMIRFRYGVPTLFLVPVPAPGSPRLPRVVYGEDGSVFILTVGALGLAAVVSFECVRSAAWLWLHYTVTMWAKGPLAPAGSSMVDYSRDTVKMVFEAKSSTSPAAVALEELTSFFPVPPTYLVGVQPYKLLPFRICIDKQNRS